MRLLSRDLEGAVGAVIAEPALVRGHQAGLSAIVLSVSLLLVCAFCSPAPAATRPRYGGTLRVEIQASIETADPPQLGPGMADLAPAFAITRWEAGRRAAFAADENAPGGRPFLDAVEVELARPPREQGIDLDVGKADLIEIPPSEARRQPAGRRTWVSQPVRVLLLLFGTRVDDPRAREALSLAVDRTAIFNVLLQRQGEISGALLPQWLSGYAFVFSAASDTAKARELAAAIPAAARSFSIGVEDAALRPIAERIALNARDAGLAVAVAPQGGAGDVRLLEVCIATADPARALAAIAAALGLPAAPPAESPDALYNAERSLLEDFRVVPLFHLADVYGVAARVKGGPGISPLGEWRFENVWLESGRP
ncbi:MAG: ABC transporter substrate-binding protein [Bryobacteraceae bacterium]